MSNSDFWKRHDEMPTLLQSIAKTMTSEELQKELRAIEKYLHDTDALARAHGVPLMIPQDITAKWLAFERELKSRGININVQPGE
jgi:heme oxygenase